MEQQATIQSEQPPSFQLGKFWLPGLVALTVIVVAVIAGFAIGPGGNSIIGQFLTASSESTSTLSGIGIWLPFGFAFGAGMVATVNPCGFVMLPAYLGMYVGDGQGDGSPDVGKVHMARQLTKHGP